MPSLENFLNKENRFYGWEVVEGTYGCQKCEADMDHAYFNIETLTLMWVCPDNHESKVELV